MIMKNKMSFLAMIILAFGMTFMACEKDDDDDNGDNGNGVSGADTIASENRVAYFKFDGSIDDEEGHTTTGQNVAYTLDRFGNMDAAYKGDTNAHVMVDPVNDLKTGSITLSMWLRNQQFAGGTQFIVTLIDPSIEWNAGYGLWQEGSDRGDTLRYKLFTKHQNSDVFVWTDTQFGEASDVYFPPSKWFQFVYTYDGNSGERAIYYNGDQVLRDTMMYNDASMGPITVPATATNFYIGANPNEVQTWVGNYEGDLDDLRVFDVALTEEQVNNLYVAESE